MSAARPVAQASGLDPEVRTKLAELEADGATTVKLAVLAQDGKFQALTNAVQDAGGKIGYRYEPAGYLRAHVPIKAVERLIAQAPIENGVLTRVLASSEPAAKDPSPPAPRQIVRTETSAMPLISTDWREDPLSLRHDPNEENGVAALRRAHPTYDGRGVTIALVEYSFDLLAPELGESSALTLEGRPVRKVPEYFTVTDPNDPAQLPSGGLPLPWPWVALQTEVAAAKDRFTVWGEQYVAPRAGQFRFGIYQGGLLCNRIDPALAEVDDREIRPSKPCQFAVLWQEMTQEVWVDTNRDRSFADEKAMRDYRVRGDIGVLGRDDPSTAARESYSFAVQTKPGSHWVAILAGLGDHATMDASSAVGARGSNGRMEGIAPGAQLISVDATGDFSTLAEGLIAAFTHPRVDLVINENGLGSDDVILFPSPTLDKNGAGPRTLLSQRLVQVTRKPMLEPGGNCNHDSCVDDMGARGWVFSVGASQSRNSWWVNEALKVQDADNNHSVSSWGPGIDGSLLPSVLAPSGWLARFIPKNGGVGGTSIYSYTDRGIPGLNHMPPGYGIGGGTSQATPGFAGAVAVLIGAAKQARVPYDARLLWLAITNSARYVPTLPVYQQGNGITDIAAAFALLQAYAKATPAITIESKGSARTGWSAKLPTPDEGVSLYEREGWTAGMRAERVVTLKRTTGPDKSMTFALSLLGNDGTFTLPSSVALPLNKPVAVPIQVAPKTNGYHSAILNIDHESVPGHAHRMMLTVVAAERFEAARGNTVTITDAIPRPGPARNYYIEVPAGAKSLIVALDSTAGIRSQTIVDPQHMSPGYRSQEWKEPQPTQTFERPKPGVWEIGVTIVNDALALRKASTGAAADPPVPVRIVVRIAT